MSEIIPLDVARQRVLTSLREDASPAFVPLSSALGHRLFADLRADGPWPSTDRAAMDGFAVVAGSLGVAAGTRLRVVGASLAGHPYALTLVAGTTVRIMTGGVVPAGADAVVAVEDTSGFESGVEGAEVTIRVAVQAGAHVRRQGSEVAAGERLIARGTRLRSAEIGALAVLGCDPVQVFRPVRVAVLATGDEVVPLGTRPAAHQVRNSNGPALRAQVLEAGGEAIDLGIAGDDAIVLGAALERAFAEADIVLTVGGVSKGTHDLVHGTLRDLGVEAVFHGVKLKPGKPAFFGVLDRDSRRRYVFGLPGNPASCYTVFDLLVRPLLEAWMGGSPAPASSVRVAGAPAVRNARQQAIPARLVARDGCLEAELDVVRPSGDPFSLLGGRGYALIPAGADPATLTRVDFVPYADQRAL